MSDTNLAIINLISRGEDEMVSSGLIPGMLSNSWMIGIESVFCVQKCHQRTPTYHY